VETELKRLVTSFQSATSESPNPERQRLRNAARYSVRSRWPVDMPISLVAAVELWRHETR
jgi:hypothetical protein